MQILSLPVARNGHAGGEESDVPQERKANCEHRVRAEDSDRSKGADDADQERNEVGDRSYCDRHGCLGHHKAHAFSHRHFGLGAPPTRQHYKGVIDADACGVDL